MVFPLFVWVFFTFSSPNKSCPLNKDSNMEKRVMFVLRWGGGGACHGAALAEKRPGCGSSRAARPVLLIPRGGQRCRLTLTTGGERGSPGLPPDLGVPYNSSSQIRCPRRCSARQKGRQAGRRGGSPRKS